MSWNCWASWCDKQKVDPFRCTLKWVLDFLAELLEQGYQYRSVCGHRSAISAFHEGIDGKSIEENPQVSSLITGIFNQRPQQPRYTYIWDFPLALDYLKKHFHYSKKLTDRQLTLKVPTSLALTSASRAGGLHNLGIRFMARTENKYSFSVNKLSKSWRQGQKPHVVEFCGYSDDEDLCVVTALDEYVLKLAGLDVSILKGYSTRAASTSKVTISGLLLSEILGKGSWSSASTWRRFYKKEIISTTAANFQNSFFVKHK